MERGRSSVSGLLYADHPPMTLDAIARVTRDVLTGQAMKGRVRRKPIRHPNETFATAGLIAKKLVERARFCYFHIIQQTE